MRITVLGASGGVGKELVQQARARGDEVVAVGRPSSTIPEGEGVEIRRGDLCDAAFLESCIAGSDAVLSGLGPRIAGLGPWNKPDPVGFVEASARAVVEAARAAGVARVVAVSAGGVGDSLEWMPGFFKLLIKTTAMRHAYPELNAMEQVYLASDLEVVIARPTGLTNGPRTGEVVEVKALHGNAQISRADVAAWMLERAGGPLPDERTPVITVTGA